MSRNFGQNGQEMSKNFAQKTKTRADRKPISSCKRINVSVSGNDSISRCRNPDGRSAEQLR